MSEDLHSLDGGHLNLVASKGAGSHVEDVSHIIIHLDVLFNLLVGGVDTREDVTHLLRTHAARLVLVGTSKTNHVERVTNGLLSEGGEHLHFITLFVLNDLWEDLHKDVTRENNPLNGLAPSCLIKGQLGCLRDLNILNKAVLNVGAAGEEVGLNLLLAVGCHLNTIPVSVIHQ